MYPRSHQPSAPLADELWLVSHSEHSGRPRITENFIGLGLAGAVLAELLMGGQIVLTEQQHVIATDVRPLADDLVTGWALSEITRTRTTVPVGRWINHLHDQVAPNVAQRLVEARLVEYVKAGLFGRKQRVVPRDPNAATSPRIRLLHQLHTGDADVPTAMLGALCVAIGLHAVIARDAGRPSLREDLVAVARRILPPDLLAVANSVRAAVTRATISIRR